MNKISGFTFFSSYHESLRDLEPEDRRALLEAIVDFVFEDIEPEFTGFKRTIWTLIVPNLITSKNKSKNAQKIPKRNQKKSKSKSKENQNENNDLLEDKDKEKDKDKEWKEDGDNTCYTTRSIYEVIEENFGRPLSPMEYETINSWMEDYSQDIIEYAVRKSVMYNKRYFSYVNGILKNWKTSGFRTLQEIKDHEIKLANQNDHKIDLDILDNWLDTDEEI